MPYDLQNKVTSIQKLHGKFLFLVPMRAIRLGTLERVQQDLAMGQRSLFTLSSNVLRAAHDQTSV